MGSLRPGDGPAIFTAECGHMFHFKCIVENVKHGNKVCPMCRTEWKDLPFLQNQITARRPALVPNFLHEPHGLRFQNVNREPNVYDDDDYVSPEYNVRGLSDSDFAEKTIEIVLHPEVSAVSRSSVYNDFNVLIHIKAPYRESFNGPFGSSSRVPVDIVTVLDVSGSMSGRKVALLKQAMGFVINNLGPSDRLSVVSFSSSAARQLPLVCMNDEGKQKALEKVEFLYCSGGTNIAEGLIKGAKVVSDRKWKNPVVSIILLSDGKDTCGHNDYKTLLPDTISTSSGIQVNTFGFGADHDAVLMHSIAENSGGTFSFIESGNAIQDAFAQCIGGLLSVAVQEVKLELNSIHQDLRINSIKAGSYHTTIANDSRSGTISVGDLYADEERNFLVSVDIPIDESGSGEMPLLKVHCTLKDPMTNGVMKVEEETELSIERVEMVTNIVTKSLQVDKQRNRLLAAEAMGDAKAAAESGDLEKAVSVLNECKKVIEVSLSANSSDGSWTELCAELNAMQEKMSSKKKYETSGRGYVLSGLSSHQRQRATTKGDSSQSGSTAYRTRFMSEMVAKSQSSILNESVEQQQQQNMQRRSAR